jgi:hypothetical protein
MYVLISEVLNLEGNQFSTNINTDTRQTTDSKEYQCTRLEARPWYMTYGQKRRGERLSILAQGRGVKKDVVASSGASMGVKLSSKSEQI